jgi:hypothetical protein
MYPLPHVSHWRFVVAEHCTVLFWFDWQTLHAAHDGWVCTLLR